MWLRSICGVTSAQTLNHPLLGAGDKERSVLPGPSSEGGNDYLEEIFKCSEQRVRALLGQYSTRFLLKEIVVEELWSRQTWREKICHFLPSHQHCLHPKPGCSSTWRNPTGFRKDPPSPNFEFPTQSTTHRPLQLSQGLGSWQSCCLSAAKSHFPYCRPALLQQFPQSVWFVMCPVPWISSY